MFELDGLNMLEAAETGFRRNLDHERISQL